MEKYIVIFLLVGILGLGAIPVLHHDTLDGFVANEHIDWRGTSVDLMTSGNVKSGSSDTTAGVFKAYGAGTGVTDGGCLQLHTAADYDTTIDVYQINIDEDDLIIKQGTTTKLTLSGATGNFTFAGTIIASSFSGLGDVLDDLNTLGAPTLDSQFIVATGAGAFAYESGATARSSLGLGIGDSPVFTDVNLSNELVVINDANIYGALTVTGTIDILHTAIEADDHALELDVDAAGFGDVKALDIDYITGTIAKGEDEGIILINIDETSATGGDVFAVEVLATDGSAGIYGLKAGALVGPIHQDSGTFANPTTGTDNTTSEPNMIDGNSVTTTAIFEADNEYIIIGAAAAFEEIEFILTTTSSNPGIKPTFWYSIAGKAQFTQFTPVDGTNGFRNTGVVAWDASDLTGHVADDVTTTFDVKVIRTQNNLNTEPVLGYAKTAATIEYIWDANGDLNVNDVNISGELDVDGLNFSGTVITSQDDLTAFQLKSNKNIEIMPDSDTSDFVRFSTTGDQTGLAWVGQNGSIQASGGTIDFDDEHLTTDGDVTGGAGSFTTLAASSTTTLQGQTIIDGDNAEMLLIRRNADACDVFIFDTQTNMGIGINKAPGGNTQLQIYRSTGASQIVHESGDNYVDYVMTNGKDGAVTFALIAGYPVADDFVIRETGENHQRIDGDGAVYFLQSYSDTVGATNIPLFMDNTGMIGAEPSGLKHKENIRPITGTEVIYDLNPVLYDRKDGSGKDLMGLIAEEVALVMPKVVGYKREIVYEMDYAEDIPAMRKKVKEIKTTDIPETVNYSRLIVPLIAEIQRLNARVVELEKGN